jgi:hypothetical protein
VTLLGLAATSSAASTDAFTIVCSQTVRLRDNLLSSGKGGAVMECLQGMAYAVGGPVRGWLTIWAARLKTGREVDRV